MPALRLDHLSCGFTGGTLAVDDVSLELAAGEFFCLLGPSGSGKSTLLRLIGGYLAPDSGSVMIGDRDVTHVPPEKRNTGMVFQNYALFPHLSALENVAFGLRVQGVNRKMRESKAHEMLDWVGLTRDERSRRPVQLSGGQQQRVALARALAFGPSLLMLDEPFANLDRSLRERLREEMREVQRRSGITAILVTHDRDEALALGDRIAVMDRGKLLQTGTPEEVYASPSSARVAGYLGHRNVLDAESACSLGLPQAAVLLPEHLLFSNEGKHRGIVQRVVFAGSRREISVRLTNGLVLEVHTAPDAAPAVGTSVSVEIPQAAVRLLREE